MRPVDASDSSHTLEELLSQPSAESWREIIEIGRRASRSPRTADMPLFMLALEKAVKHWPPEIERLCPASWPADFRAAVEHRVRETDTYGHYLAKICGHPDLKLSDGSQAVWLERRYTGGIVEVSTVKSALRLLAAAQTASSVKTANDRVKDAVRLLAGGTRNVGKVGCADLTGGITIESVASYGVLAATGMESPRGYKTLKKRTRRHKNLSTIKRHHHFNPIYFTNCAMRLLQHPSV